MPDVQSNTGGAVIDPRAFMENSRKEKTIIDTSTFTGFGQTKSIQLPQTGFLGALRMQVQLTVVTGTSPTGTFDANFSPFNFLSNIVLKSNEGLEFARFGDGFRNLVINQCEHMVGNTKVTSPYNPFNSSKGAQNAYGANMAIAGTALVASTTYKTTFMIHIPVYVDLGNLIGMPMLQAQQVRCSLDFATCAITDLLGAGATLGAGGTVSATTKTEMEFFSIPADVQARPDTSCYHHYGEEVIPWSASGDFVYKYPVNGIPLRVWMLFQQNSGGTFLPQDLYATAGDGGTNNFSAQKVSYGGTQYPEITDFMFESHRYRQIYGLDPVPGCIPFDFSTGKGSVELGTSMRDVYDTGALTEFALTVTTGISPPAGSRVIVIREEIIRLSS